MIKVVVNNVSESVVTLKAANDAADETALDRLGDDIKKLCLRHGKSRVINTFLDAWRLADSEGAKW